MAQASVHHERSTELHLENACRVDAVAEGLNALRDLQGGALAATQEASASASDYFGTIGGAGSPTDLILRGKALVERGRMMAREQI